MAEKAEVIFRITAEDGTQRVFQQVMATENKMAQVTEKADKAIQRKAASMHKMTMTAKKADDGIAKLSNTVIGMAAGAVSIAAITSAISALDSKLGQIAQRGNEATLALEEFYALQADGPEGQEFVKEIAIRGAEKFGLTAGQTGTIAQPLQSAIDKNANSKVDVGAERAAFDDAFETAAKLITQQVSEEDAKAIVLTGLARGKSAANTGDLFMKAADMSAVGPKDLAKAASSTLSYSSLENALALTTALSTEEVNPERLPTLVERLGKVIGKGSEKEDFQQKMGIGGKGMDEIQKIDALLEVGNEKGKGDTRADRIRDFSERLQEFGVMEENERKSLGIVLRKAEVAKATRAAFVGADGNLDAKYAAIDQNPARRQLLNSKRDAATKELDTTFGANASIARTFQSEEQGISAAMAGDPLMSGLMLNGEGNLNWIGKTALWASRGISAATGSRYQQSTPQLESQTQAVTEKLLKEHAEALKANTEATKANTAATGGGTGRPSRNVQE